MAKIEKLDLMIEGGNARPDASVAQRLGPLKVNMADVMKRINEKTAALKGIRVPVKLEVNVDTKEVNISVGSPPTHELVKKELGLEKGSGMPDKDKIANVGIEQVIKIAKMKREGMYVNSMKAAIKTVAGSMNSAGILIEGMTSDVFNKELEAGKFDNEVKNESSEIAPEKKKKLQEQLVVVQERLKKEQEKLKALAEAAAEKKPEAAAAAEGAPVAEAKPGEAKAEAGKSAAPGAKPAAGAKPEAGAKPAAGKSAAPGAKPEAKKK